MKFIDKLGAITGKQWIVIIILIIVGIFLYNVYLQPKASDIKRKLTPPRNTDGTKNDPISDERKTVLNDLATSLRTAIYDTTAGLWGRSREDVMQTMLGLNDNELTYVNKHYRTLGDNTMYYDIDYEWMPMVKVDDDLLTRLRELNLDQK